MAHHVEPMDIDSDFDNKENSLHHNNVLPFTEKGYEELDVSELNMKLRYSITPASSPMSKSYTANCLDNRSLESDNSPNVKLNENSNLTRSLNSTMIKNDSVIKSLKAVPLQALPTEQFVDKNRSSVFRPLVATVTQDNANVTVTVSKPTDIDENLSLPSSSSSLIQTPEATTPTKDIQKNDGGSPIMRGIKSVLNMFRSSQSPIPSADSEGIVKSDILSPAEATIKVDDAKTQAMLVSTPISAHRKKETTPTKRSSPQKDSIVFNEDLEKELLWKDETTIIFSQERIPIHKLFFQQPQNENRNSKKEVELLKPDAQENLDSTVEYMDVSYNDSIRDKTVTDITTDNKLDCTIAGESDGEFLDCETTFTKNESLLDDNDKTAVIDKTQDLDLTKDVENTNENTSASRLKQIILNTTQDILNATLTITPEDLIPEALDKTKDISSSSFTPETTEVTVTSGTEVSSSFTPEITEVTVTSDIEVFKGNDTTDLRADTEKLSLIQENQPSINQKIDDMSSSVNIGLIKDANIVKTIENSRQPILDQTIEITNSLTNMENKEDFNVTKTIEGIPAELVLENQPNSKKNEEQDELSIDTSVNSLIPKNAAIVLDSKIVEDRVVIPDNTQAIDLTNNDLSSTHIITEHGAKTPKNSVAELSCPALLDEVRHKPLPYPDEVVASPFKEASVTELPIDIPLPDEDDLEKEQNVPVDTSLEVSSVPNSLSLDLVDDIKVKIEIPEIIHNMSPEGANVKLENYVHNNNICLPEVLPPLHTPGIEGGDNIQHQTEAFNPNVIKADQGVIANAEVQSEMPLHQETRHINMDVIAENVVVTSNDNNAGLKKELKDVETVNNTENYQSLMLNQNVPMDIHESIIELKHLPDIINQTIIMSSGETLEQPVNVPDSIILDQPSSMSGVIENTASQEAACLELRPEVHNKDLTELFNSVDAKNELTNAIKDELPITQPMEEMNKDPTVTVSESCITEAFPVIPENFTGPHLYNIDVSATDNKIQPSDIHNIHANDGANIKTVDEEIVLSENNSPYVSVIAEIISKEKNPKHMEKERDQVHVEDERTTIDNITSLPPASPPIASKGYNFNFDDIDDPFATKTKIRTSPALDSPTKINESKPSSIVVERPMRKKEINNRRKSQPESKKPIAPKKKLNSTFSGSKSEKMVEKSIEELVAGDIKLGSPAIVALNPSNVTVEEDKIIQEANLVHRETLNLTQIVLQNELEFKLDDKIEQPVEIPSTETDEEVKTTSSSEQSTYYSAGTSSSGSVTSRNVFNLPEIDDVNFNPFVSKSKIRQSPPPCLEMENPFATNSKIRNSSETATNIVKDDVQETAKPVSSDEKIDTELMEKDASENLNNTTISSKTTDERNITMREVNTEDEDTIEGPFLEVEDLNTEDKMSDFDGENIDMMQFNELPAQSNEDNIDSGELFIDAEAFEFLLNQNKSNTVVDSGKESLFLKFDPLFAKRMSSVTSDGVVASLNKIQKRQSTPTKSAGSPQKEVITPIAGPSNLNVTKDMNMNVSEEYNDDLNVTVSKPMMVVPPAVSPVTPRNKLLTPNRSNRRSVTFTSPAMAVIDRLLSLSGNSSLVHDTTVTQVSREQNEAELALTQLRELLAEKEIHVYSLRSESKELKNRLTTLEAHLKNLEAESQGRLTKINDLNDRLAEKTKINKSMAAVVEEYERTIASLISETAQDKKKHAEERIKLINERDEQTAHLASMEVSFSDLHSKYEKSKQVILNCKANEDAYKKSIKEFEENLNKMQTNYELLKQHATSKLNHANQELEKMNRTHEAEVLKLNAMIKRKELHITSLEESLAQKTKANEELTAICDELINKVG